MVLFCAMVTFGNRVYNKYKDRQLPFTNYEVAIVVGPSMLIGAKIGAIFNYILSPLALLIILALILVNSIFSNINNIHKVKNHEKIISMQPLESSLNLKNELNEPLINLRKRLSFEEVINQKDVPKLLTEEEKAFLEKDELPLRLNRLGFMLILELLLLGNQFLEGGFGIPSIFGITRCSPLFWIVFLSFVVISFLMIFIAFQISKRHIEERRKIDPSLSSELIRELRNHYSYIILKSIYGGVVSSTCGIGGGMVLNPLFAEMGLDPKESRATSNFLIITTGIGSMILFFFNGQIDVTFTTQITVPCCVCAFLGSFFILGYASKRKQTTTLHEVMLYMMFISLLLILVRIYFKLERNTISQIFVVGPYCTNNWR